MLYAAQIAESFLAYRSNECNGPRSPDFCMVQGPDDTDHDGETAAIVGDAGTFERRSFPRDFDVCAFGKDRVEMGGDDDMRMERRPRPFPEDVARLVAPDVPEACLLKQTLHFFGARGFFERGRGDFGESDLCADCLRLVVLRRGQRGCHGGL